ncbi:MAG: hypothetical protein Q7R54_02405 [bacterium]|nr:hypothetical protein [bacterium]
MPPLSNKTFFTNKLVLLLVALVVIGLAFWLGRFVGYGVGYKQAQTDVETLQGEAARKSAEEAAKSANPFQAVNPLEGVEANPFDKVKKVLNPFEN